MLEKVGEKRPASMTEIPVSEAAFPAPFAPGLEFNSPAHGAWNIVHTGMLVPGAHQIYVCSQNCLRGVVLTAAEMNASERFSSVILEEQQLIEGNLEDATIEGVTEVLRRLPRRPPAVLLFTVCLHHFLGCDLKRVYRELEKRFPDIFFMRCYMDPIMQKKGLTPDQKLRRSLYDALPVLSEDQIDPDSVTLLGSDFALEESSDLCRLLKGRGMRLRQLPQCDTWEEYLALSKSRLFLCVYPPAQYGAVAQAGRLGREYLYLPLSFDYDEIRRCLMQLDAALASEERPTQAKAMLPISFQEEIDACEAALFQARREIQDLPIVIDASFHPRPLGLAKLLLVHGFAVEKIYLDAISPEEEAEFHWLGAHAPSLLLSPTIRPEMRLLLREGGRPVLALGQKAAWFHGTRHFVNLVEGGGLYGFEGIRRLAALLGDACREEKDTEDLIIRKGWGCESCL